MIAGDIVQIAANATRVFRHWGNTLEEVKKQAGNPEILRCQDQKGNILIDQELPKEYDGYPNLYCNRGGVQKIMYDHAISLGVEFQFSARITKVFDDALGAGIYVGDKNVTADVVVVADGVHSKGRAYITGKADKPVASGFAVYRSWFSMDALKGEPLLEEIVNSKDDLFRVWIALNTHGIVVTNVKLQTVVCFITHKVTHLRAKITDCIANLSLRQLGQLRSRRVLVVSRESSRNAECSGGLGSRFQRSCGTHTREDSD